MNTLFLEKCYINLLTIPRAQHSYLTFRSGHHHTYTHLSRTHAWIHHCHRPSHRCRRRTRSLMTQPALSRRVGVIYAALDEAVSFVSLTSPVSLSERLSARVAPCYPATPQQALTQLRRVTPASGAASVVAYAAGQVTFAGPLSPTQPPDVDNLSTCRHPGCLHFLR